MPKGLRILHLSVEEHNLTHFGGIVLVHQFCKKLRVKWHLQKKLRLHQGSGRYHPVELILAIIYALIAGIYRLNKTKILQANGAFQKIIGLASFPYASSLRRFLKRVNSKTTQDINNVHDYLRLKMFYLPRPRTALLFDLDSTVFTIYGKHIEGANVGYNPHKRGARSYHPLLCFEFHSRDLWHGILRPGDASSSTGSVLFIKECLQKLPPYTYRIRIRADAGFFDHKLVEVFEQNNIGYVIVAKITNPIRNCLAGLRYHRFRQGWGAAEFQYTPFQWKNPRRFIAIRRPLPEKDSDQLTLFTMERYTYQVFVTNLPLTAKNIWYFYRGRASIEKNIRELKENFALAKIPTNNFQANQVYFHLLLFAYNIVNWFKRLCLPPQFRNATLETIRTEFLVLPARLVKTDHQNMLRLPAEYISKKTLNQIIHKIERLNLL